MENDSVKRVSPDYLRFLSSCGIRTDKTREEIAEEYDFACVGIDLSRRVIENNPKKK